jgi:hypothetical protein
MGRVLPSQVVTIIDRMFPWAISPSHYGNYNIVLDRGRIAEVVTIINLIQQVPTELFLVTGELYTAFLASIGALRGIVTAWQGGGNDRLAQMPGFQEAHVLTHIRRALVACPDDFPAPGTAALSFIADSDFRDTLRLDISATNRALANEEWKAATVLAGSVVEALLLWSLQQKTGAEIQAAPVKKPSKPLEEWYLSDYIDVATALGIIEAYTASQVRLAQDYRNLIHPGRAIRLGIHCDRGTALGAVAALEVLIRDLNRKRL